MADVCSVKLLDMDDIMESMCHAKTAVGCLRTALKLSVATLFSPPELQHLLLNYDSIQR